MFVYTVVCEYTCLCVEDCFSVVCTAVVIGLVCREDVLDVARMTHDGHADIMDVHENPIHQTGWSQPLTGTICL